MCVCVLCVVERDREQQLEWRRGEKIEEKMFFFSVGCDRRSEEPRRNGPYRARAPSLKSTLIAGLVESPTFFFS